MPGPSVSDGGVAALVTRPGVMSRAWSLAMLLLSVLTLLWRSVFEEYAASRPGPAGMALICLTSSSRFFATGSRCSW